MSLTPDKGVRMSEWLEWLEWLVALLLWNPIIISGVVYILVTYIYVGWLELSMSWFKWKERTILFPVLDGVKENLLLNPQVLKDMDISIPEVKGISYFQRDINRIRMKKKVKAIAKMLQAFGYTAFLVHGTGWPTLKEWLLCIRYQGYNNP
jgi:hypothetical protein